MEDWTTKIKCAVSFFFLFFLQCPRRSATITRLRSAICMPSMVDIIKQQNTRFRKSRETQNKPSRQCKRRDPCRAVLNAWGMPHGVRGRQSDGFNKLAEWHQILPRRSCRGGFFQEKKTYANHLTLYVMTAMRHRRSCQSAFGSLSASMLSSAFARELPCTRLRLTKRCDFSLT